MPKLPFARFANIALAGWLFFACLHWPHLANRTLVVALFMTALITAFELMALMEPSVRFATTAMGALLVLEAIFLKHWLPWVRWHDAAIGVLVMLFSLVPNAALPAGEPAPAAEPK